MFRKKKSTKVLFKHQAWDHKIKLESETQLTFEFIYAIFEKKLKTLWQYLNKNERKRFIRKSQSSTKYSILFVLKKNDTFRLCVDYRKLNDITIKNRYLLSNISELQDRLSEVRYFIKLNLRWIYNLIRIKEEKKWKTVFRIRYEHYEYTIMSFELINVSTTCQEMINDALREYFDDFVIAYLNDILVYSKTLKEYVKHVNKILNCINRRNLRLKSKKYEFHRENVNFLKFVVERQEIKIDLNKLKAIKNWKTLTNVKETQVFFEIRQLQSKVYKRLFTKNYTLDRFYDQRQSMIMKKKRKKRVSRFETSVFKRINTEDVQSQEVNTSKDRRIRSRYWSVSQSRT